MGFKSRWLSSGKITINLLFSSFTFLLPSPVRRESSILCFCVQVTIATELYKLQPTSKAYHPGTEEMSLSHSSVGQQSMDSSWSVPEMSWGSWAEEPSQGAWAAGLIRPPLYVLVLMKTHCISGEKKNERKSAWQLVWSSHVPFVLGRRHSLISLGTCSSAGQSMMRQQSRLVQVQGWQMQKSVLCCPHCFQHSLRVFVGVVWAHDLLGLGRQQLVQCQSWQRWVGLCWCVAPAAMGADACATGKMLSWLLVCNP